MDTVYLELKPIDDRNAELRYRVPGQVQYAQRPLLLAEIRELYGFADDFAARQRDLDFAKHSSDLARIGKKLFEWLDGAERWLSRSIQQQRGLLVLAIEGQGELGGLPWEVLYYEGFLVARSIVPIRVVGGWQEQAQRQPSPHQLRVLFMATDPIDVQPTLSFEAEEALILQETRELALDLRVEESGCVEELQGFWRRFKDYFDVFHLSGHAGIDRAGVPFFITESLEGQRVDARVADLAAAFNLRYPALMFLSGCRTAESTRQGGVASLAASLVEQGAPAVLGWVLPVADRGAIAAAMVLYRSLAEGFALAEALALTYQELIKEQVADWCLLRLYARWGAWGELVQPPGDVVRQRLPEASTEFLDPQGLVRVAGKDGFVGRRRYLQWGLRTLKSPEVVGLWLYGLGGVGKSTIACRLLDRLSPSYDRLVISGVVDVDGLLKLLAGYCENSVGSQILANVDLSLTQKLTQFFKSGLNDAARRLVLVLDDFEQNVERREFREPVLRDGKPVLLPEAVEVLMAVVEGIVRSQLPHRVIVTCRYDVVLPAGGDRRIRRLPVDRMDRSDAAKLMERLVAFDARFGVPEDLRLEAQRVADGYPRLLEALDRVLQDERTDAAAILTALAGKQQEFLVDIFFQELLAQQELGLKEMLQRGMLFELPVPVVVLEAICGDLVGLAGHLERARALGLLESGLQVGVVRVPRVLGLELVGDGRELAVLGVPVLYGEWSAGNLGLEQQQELYRLAMLAGNGEIAVAMAQSLSNRWIDLSLFQAAQSICIATLALRSDGVLIYNLSKIYKVLGDMAQALKYCEQSIKIYKEIGDRQGEAASLHQLSIIYRNLGDYPQALSFSQQSIEISREIGDRQGEAASLHQLSMIYRNLGDYTQALSFSEQSIEILKEIGDRQGEAASLHQLSMIYESLGDYPQALSFSEQSIEIYREIGDRQGEAASLHQLSMIYRNLGDYPQALSFSEQSIEITKEIGDQQGEAASLHQLSIIYKNLGDYPQALSFFEQSIKILREIGDQQGEAASFHQLSMIYESLGDYPQALFFSEQSIEIIREIGGRQGEAASLAQMATIAYQQGNQSLGRELWLQAAVIRGSIEDYGGLIITLWNLGRTDVPDAPDVLGFLAQSLWLTVHCATNLKNAINLIATIYQQVPAGDDLSPLLAATARYFCHTRSHPELPQLTERSNQLLTHAAQQRGIEAPADLEQWLVAEQLQEPAYFLPALLHSLEAIIGEGWLFDRAAFQTRSSSPSN